MDFDWIDHERRPKETVGGLWRVCRRPGERSQSVERASQEPRNLHRCDLHVRSSFPGCFTVPTLLPDTAYPKCYPERSTPIAGNDSPDTVGTAPHRWVTCARPGHTWPVTRTRAESRLPTSTTKLFAIATGALVASLAALPFLVLWFAVPLRRLSALENRQRDGARCESGRLD